MDIISSFADPIGGILANYSTLKTAESEEALTKFWEYCWCFMDTIYRCTLVWASKYEYSELENFTKDTLELSRSLISLYREFSDILGKNSVELFNCVLKTFDNMLYWLRLSDEELLASCIRLIIATTDLAQEKSINIDDMLIEKMAKYASKYRKFSNKLTEAQSSQILAKTRLFNVGITNQVIEEADKYHREKERLKQKSIQSSSPSPSYTPAENKADFLQRKALSSSIIGRPRQSQPGSHHLEISKSLIIHCYMFNRLLSLYLEWNRPEDSYLRIELFILQVRLYSTQDQDPVNRKMKKLVVMKVILKLTLNMLENCLLLLRVRLKVLKH